MTVKCLSTSFLRQHVPNYDSTVIFLASCPEPHHNPLPNRDSLQLLQSMQCVAQSYGWNVCEFPVAEESPCREFPETHISAANTQNTENAPTDPQFFHPTKYTKCAKWPPVQIHIHFMQERICLLKILSPSAGCWLSICSAAKAAAAEKCDSNSARKRMKHPLQCPERDASTPTRTIRLSNAIAPNAWNIHSETSTLVRGARSQPMQNTLRTRRRETAKRMKRCSLSVNATIRAWLDHALRARLPPNLELPRSPKPCACHEKCPNVLFFSFSLRCRSHRKFLNQSFFHQIMYPWFWSQLMTVAVSPTENDLHPWKPRKRSTSVSGKFWAKITSVKGGVDPLPRYTCHLEN